MTGVVRDREAPKQEGERLGPRFEVRNRMRVVVEPCRPRDPPAGSVDLRSLRYPPEAAEDWGKGVRVQDCITTTNAAFDELVEIIAGSLAEHLNDLDDDLSKKIIGLDAKVAVLQRENAELREEVGDLAHHMKRIGAIRGTDGYQLPEALVGRRSRAAAKRKRGATVEAPPP